MAGTVGGTGTVAGTVVGYGYSSRYSGGYSASIVVVTVPVQWRQCQYSGDSAVVPDPDPCHGTHPYHARDPPAPLPRVPLPRVPLHHVELMSGTLLGDTRARSKMSVFPK